MSIHFKITPFKASSAGAKHKVSKGGKKAAKGHVPFGLSLGSAKGRGFRGKLRALGMAGAQKTVGKGRGGVTPSAAHPETALRGKKNLSSRVGVFSSGKIKSEGKSVTSGKAVAQKKRVQAQAESSPLFVPALSQTVTVPHKKKIVSLYKKSGPHQVIGSKDVRLKDVGKVKGGLHKVSTKPETLRAGFTPLAKARVKALRKGPTADAFVLKGTIPSGRAHVQGKAELLKTRKGRVKARGHVKIVKDGVSAKSPNMRRAGRPIKKVIDHKGPHERFSEVQAKKGPLEKTVERGPLDKPIDLTHSLPAKPISLKARAEALRGGMILPLKGVALRGAGKKTRPALVSSQAVKKAGSKSAGLKKKAVKGLRRVRGTPVKAAFEAQTETLKGIDEVSEGVTLSEGLPIAFAAPHETTPGRGQGLSLTGGNGKAVFKDPSAIINTSVSIATERVQARGSVLTVAPRHDLAGRERELIEKASGGVLLSLRQADKEIVIKLSPEELGRMEIKVKVHHGLVDASILVDNPDVLAMLNANNTVLKDQLARQGLMLGGLDVALNGQEPPSQGRAELKHGKSGRYGRGRQAVKGVGQGGEGRAMAVKAPREGGAQGGLDLFI